MALVYFPGYVDVFLLYHFCTGTLEKTRKTLELKDQ